MKLTVIWVLSSVARLHYRYINFFFSTFANSTSSFYVREISVWCSYSIKNKFTFFFLLAWQVVKHSAHSIHHVILTLMKLLINTLFGLRKFTCNTLGAVVLLTGSQQLLKLDIMTNQKTSNKNIVTHHHL